MLLALKRRYAGRRLEGMLNAFNPRVVVDSSSACHGLWALTKELQQQLRADHEAGGGCPRWSVSPSTNYNPFGDEGLAALVAPPPLPAGALPPPTGVLAKLKKLYLSSSAAPRSPMPAALPSPLRSTAARVATRGVRRQRVKP
jgi:hypothetical protein